MPIATDSATELRNIIGKDSTATFEDDPTFVDSNPGAGGSSENVEEQRDTDDLADSDEELEDEDVLDEEDEEDEFDDEDDDDEEEEDDSEEVAASGLRADGLLGYEDEVEDVEKKRSPQKSVDPDSLRIKRHARAIDTEGDDDSGDLAPGVDEDALNSSEDDEIDTDRVAAAAFTQRLAATLQQYATY